VSELQGIAGKAEEEALLKAGEGASELVATKAELQSKNELLGTLKAECSDYQAKLHVSESQRETAEKQRTEMVTQKEAMAATLQMKEDLIASLQRTAAEKQQGLVSQLSQEQKMVQHGNAELDTMRATVSQRDAELATLKSQLENTGSSLSKLQIQNTNVQKELDEVSRKLNVEITQNQDRKKKVKDYVTQITSEKTTLEERLAQAEQQFREAQSGRGIAEQNLKLLEMKIATAQEQAQLERETLQRENEATVSGLRTEVENLQRIVDTYNKGTVEQVQEAHKQVQDATRELEAHKAKRLAARNEMIGMAQALEKAQVSYKPLFFRA
jgi:chromosome segregation ATPase